MSKKTFHTAQSIIFIICFLISGCAANAPARQFSDLLRRYPQTTEPLKLQRLTEKSFDAALRGADAGDVTIMVHPAYSLFFRDSERSSYSETKYLLLRLQLDREARVASELSKAGKTLILIIPGDYRTESIAPLSYTFYLNTVVAPGRSVYYLYSETWNKGGLAMNDMILLYRFLQTVKAGKVLLGGGYIGRCQREFHTQLTTYFDKAHTYIVPELSSISPDDLSEKEASDLLAGLRKQDYSLVRRFIDKKTEGNANILSLPQKREL